MKTLLISILTLGVILQNYGQEVSVVKNAETTDTTIANNSKAANTPYLEAVKVIESISIISTLQNEAANYNIGSIAIFDNFEAAIYLVVFISGKHKLEVSYNNHGDIVKSNETYYNINIPFDLKVNIAKRYPLWEFSKTKCSIHYNYKKGSNITYGITLKKGSKTIKIKDVASL